MLRDIILHGSLRKKFGASFRMDVASPVEAVRALIIQIKGFRDHLKEGNFRVIRKAAPRKVGHDLALEQLNLRLSHVDEIHIVPVVAGAAHGLGKILAGVAIIGLAIAAPFALGLGGLGATAFGVSSIGLSVTYGQVAAVGLALALSGVSQLLSPSAKTQAAQAQNASFLFGSQDNTIAQGGPVPLVYGTFRTGSVVISSGLHTEQLI